jgi:hypothetical protein
MIESNSSVEHNECQGHVRVREGTSLAALPPALRKASGFPFRLDSLYSPRLAGRLSLPAERGEQLRKCPPERQSLSAKQAAEPLFSGLRRDRTMNAARVEIGHRVH